MTAASGFWDDAEVISRYSAENAVEDGVLYDARKLPGGAGEITGQFWPNPDAHIYISVGLYVLMGKAVARKAGDWKGIWWDVLSMARMYGALKRAQSECLETGQGWGRFKVTIKGAERKSLFFLKVSLNIEGMTFMLQEED